MRLDFGDLLFMRRWYSSCACLMPLSPVTVLTVTKGSSNRSLRLSWTITCGWLCAKAIGAVIDLENWCKASAEVSSLALCQYGEFV